jgi:hypothetical protein
MGLLRLERQRETLWDEKGKHLLACCENFGREASDLDPPRPTFGLSSLQLLYHYLQLLSITINLPIRILALLEPLSRSGGRLHLRLAAQDLPQRCIEPSPFSRVRSTRIRNRMDDWDSLLQLTEAHLARVWKLQQEEAAMKPPITFHTLLEARHYLQITTHD